MTGFKPRTSVVGIDRPTNCATSTARCTWCMKMDELYFVGSCMFQLRMTLNFGIYLIVYH